MLLRTLQRQRVEVRLEIQSSDWWRRDVQANSNPFSSRSNLDALAKMQLGSWEYDIVTPAYKCNMTISWLLLVCVQSDRYPSLLNVVRTSWTAMIVVCRFRIHPLAHKTETVESSRHLYITHVEVSLRTQSYHPRIAKAGLQVMFITNRFRFDSL